MDRQGARSCDPGLGEDGRYVTESVTRGQGVARYLSRGVEKSRKTATNSGMWFLASRVMTCRILFLAWGIWMAQRWWWMAWPILPTWSRE